MSAPARATDRVHVSAGPALGLAPLALALCVALAALLWFGTLGTRHLLSSDEGRYAEIAREMAVTGDWITVRYHGVKYFEKPPLQMWATALAFEAFGTGEWQARLWVALCGAAGIVLSGLAAARWWGPRIGLFAGAVLLSTPNWNIGAHFNSLDMGVSGALAAVLASALIAQHPDASPSARRRWMLACWAAMAAAVLTKGLIGLALPGLALLAYTAWTRDFGLWRRLHLVAGSALFLAITVPWFAFAADRNPEFLRFFFIHEHFERYTSTVHRRDAPAWYFVPQLVAGFLPWLALLPGMVATVRRAEPVRGRLQPERLLAAWAISIFVFFSLSGSKLPGYILPVMPALAILAARALDAMSPRAWTIQSVLAVVAGLALCAVPLVVTLQPGLVRARPEAAGYAPWVGVAGAALALGAAAAWWWGRRGRRVAAAIAYAFGAFAATTAITVGHEAFGGPASGAALVPAIRKVLTPDMPIYGVQRLDHTLPFYLGRTLTLVAEPDELAFGLEREPERWIPTIEQFVPRWRDGPRALAVMAPDTYERLRAQSLPMHAVARDDRRVVVANFETTR